MRRLALGFMIYATGCGGSDPAGPDTSGNIASVDVSPASVTLEVGFQERLDAVVKNGRGEIVEAAVSWRSDDLSTASVGFDGTVTARRGGTTEIRAEAGGISKSVSVTVTDTNTREAPAGLNEPVTVHATALFTGDGIATFTLVERFDGETAAQIVQDWNQFNDPAPPGHEYILARFEVAVVSLDDPNRAFETWSGDFETVTTSGLVIPRELVSGESPRFDRQGFAGSMWDGWVAFVSPLGDPAPTAVLMREELGEAWFALR